MSSQVSDTIRSVSEVHATPVASAFGTDLQMLDHFGRLYDVTHDLLCVVGFGGRSKFLNSSWESVLGHSHEELMATHYIEFIHPDDRAATLADAEKVMAGIPTTSFENRLRCKDGSYRWFSWAVTASLTQQLVYSAGRDITEHKRSEERIFRLADAMENNSEMICMSGADGRSVFVNRALLQATGYREEELLGKTSKETLFSPNNPATLAEEYQASILREGRWRGECLQRRKDGSDLPISLSISVLRDSAGRVTGA